MVQQLDMYARSAVRVTPAPGRRQPRLWIRRVVLWSDPETVIRDITLKPGVNIVWSPDPRDTGGRRAKAVTAGTVGHGSGKTLFCRLIRYCLGEERFAPQIQREAIASAFRDGFVGVEVVVDGSPWAVVRTIGHRRRHVAIEGGTLEDVVATTGPAPGIEAFVAALVAQVVGADAASLMPGPPSSAWPVVLAWLARDQECRFGHVLDWRSPASESDSPVRDFTRLQALTAVRVCIGAIDRAEHEHVAQLVTLEAEARKSEEDLRHTQWAIARLSRRLSSVLGVEGSISNEPLGVLSLRAEAAQRLATAAGVQALPGVTADLETRRREARSAQTSATELAKQVAALDAEVPLRERTVSMLAGEIPAASARLQTATKPTCPICEVPIDQALVEGCKLSHKLPGADRLRAQLEERQRALGQEQASLDESKTRRHRLRQELLAAQSRARAVEEQVSRLEAALDARHANWLEARRIADDVERLADTVQAEGLARERLGAAEAKLEQTRETAVSFREQKASVIQALSGHFDAMVQALAGEGARGQVTLTGKGLQLAVLLGGDRSSPAIDSLKVIAFDLAVLAMSIEGKTHVPPFLVHDSPREADLGLSIYERLFEAAIALESVGPSPLFQYIITTTTRPPSSRAKKPWLRLTLHGAPPEKRLFGRDL